MSKKCEGCGGSFGYYPDIRHCCECNRDLCSSCNKNGIVCYQCKNEEEKYQKRHFKDARSEIKKYKAKIEKQKKYIEALEMELHIHSIDLPFGGRE